MKKGVQALEKAEGVQVCARGAAGEGPNRGRAALFSTAIGTFLSQESLQHEVFGASSMVVRCKSIDDMRQVAERIEGQLTVTLHLDEPDYELARGLVPVLERKAGRILANGWPTGVEVAHAMVHGGPFPAASDSRFTSVGTLAIRRFLRPVSYQGLAGAIAAGIAAPGKCGARTAPGRRQAPAALMRGQCGAAPWPT